MIAEIATSRERLPMSSRAVIPALLVLLCCAHACAGAAETARPVVVVDVSRADPSERLLAASLQGLANRDGAGPRVFLLGGGREAEWLEYSLRFEPAEVARLTPAELLDLLRPAVKGQALYDSARPWTLEEAPSSGSSPGPMREPSTGWRRRFPGPRPTKTRGPR